MTKRILPESLLEYFLRFFLLCLNCDCYSNRRKYVAFSSFTFSAEKWYFVFKIVLTYCEKNSYIDQEKLLQLIGLQSQICKIMRSLKSGFLLLQKIFQISILSRKFEFPALNSKQLIQIFCWNTISAK